MALNHRPPLGLLLYHLSYATEVTAGFEPATHRAALYP